MLLKRRRPRQCKTGSRSNVQYLVGEGGVEGLHAAPAAHTAHGGGQCPQHIRGAHTQAGAQLSLAQAEIILKLKTFGKFTTYTEMTFRQGAFFSSDSVRGL